MGDDDDDEMRSSSSSYRVLLISAGASHSVALLCIYKALELRDGGPDYLGKGLLKAEHNVNLIIAPALIGKDPTKQTEIDNFMVHEIDDTVNEWGWCKQKLGANAILAVSLGVCKASHIANLAGNKNLVLPVPAFNVINGGSHAGNKLAMLEFMILPVGASSFKESMKMDVEVYHQLKVVIKNKYGCCSGVYKYGNSIVVENIERVSFSGKNHEKQKLNQSYSESESYPTTSLKSPKTRLGISEKALNAVKSSHKIALKEDTTLAYTQKS
ncbi:hypothetical protein ACFE04_008073 [Oxalis oulophora]